MLYRFTAITFVVAMLAFGQIALAGDSPDRGAGADGTSATRALARADGFNGIWYSNQRQDDEYKYKYSGGFATYPQQHIPVAIYRPEVDKTFFTYGGAKPGTRDLLHMVSYFDHKTGKVARPRILLDKHTSDAHDNPVMAIDDEGYIFIYSPAHGTSRPTFIHKSLRPYSIDEFTSLPTFNFSYPQPKFIPGKGFLFLHTKYQGGRALYMATSPDGSHWENERLLARIGEGHYQISNHRADGSVATAFNYHPKPGGLNKRTNIYYMETADMGRTWTTVDKKPVSIPIKTTGTAALIHNYEKDGLLVYMKDIAFDADGHPVILYLTSQGYASGPVNDPRTWYTTHWTGTTWKTDKITTSSNNYDFGSLYIEPDGTWRIIGAAILGPQPYNTGGEVGMWTSADEGTTWKLDHQLTSCSQLNHAYVRRPVNAQEDFYALWADGHGRQPSDSSLYFTNKTGDNVWKLPKIMTTEFATPGRVPDIDYKLGSCPKSTVATSDDQSPSGERPPQTP